jgi:hypothetical protein
MHKIYTRKSGAYREGIGIRKEELRNQERNGEMAAKRQSASLLFQFPVLDFSIIPLPKKAPA